jgi:adenylate cyclase
VIQQDGDVFGDTVNLASRLTGQAVKGQIVTSHDTLALLGPIYRGSTRKLYTIQVKGRVEEVGLCELIWRQSDDATTFATKRPEPQTKPVVLRLRYRGAELVRRREADSVTLGREQSCGLVVPDSMASRQHCTVERRGDKFVLRDHSTNGTYVTTEGDQEIVLRREEVTLRLRGWIALGQSRAATEEVVEYLCD